MIVSGAPASGKTTIADLLGHDGGLRLFSKDAVKEALADAPGLPRSVEESQALGIGAYAALFSMAIATLGAGVDAALESNFRRGLSEPYLAGIAEAADTKVVHCTASAVTIAQRNVRRAADRHPTHLDRRRGDDLGHDLRNGTYDPLALDVPCLIVRTDDGYQPSYAEVRAFALARAA